MQLNKQNVLDTQLKGTQLKGCMALMVNSYWS